MKKIPKRLLWQLDILFYAAMGLLAATWMTGLAGLLVATVLTLAGYVWSFFRLKCPHCHRNIMPWTALRAKHETVCCPHCGMALEVG